MPTQKLIRIYHELKITLKKSNRTGLSIKLRSLNSLTIINLTIAITLSILGVFFPTPVACLLLVTCAVYGWTYKKGTKKVTSTADFLRFSPEGALLVVKTTPIPYPELWTILLPLLILAAFQVSWKLIKILNNELARPDEKTTEDAATPTTPQESKKTAAEAENANDKKKVEPVVYTFDVFTENKGDYSSFSEPSNDREPFYRDSSETSFNKEPDVAETKTTSNENQPPAKAAERDLWEVLTQEGEDEDAEVEKKRQKEAEDDADVDKFNAKIAAQNNSEQWHNESIRRSKEVLEAVHKESEERAKQTALKHSYAHWLDPIPPRPLTMAETVAKSLETRSSYAEDAARDKFFAHRAQTNAKIGLAKAQEGARAAKKRREYLKDIEELSRPQ